ncbi:hypothetical protein TNIN_258091 [Trichonephila inaurata madagascariensis]|uniref:Endonuclease/exonuclease/phosphatase domain-containing protein n=1 Tax=Trichonephila inaurata madagascariensis TaxID=2747483 RepID=A0A8X6YFD0_9ARAC|nr:hypothetical protein TNIN_258091 [Trichonephila inaurata madagascariensis]
MTIAIYCDINNATVSVVADALCSHIREHLEKYATRTLNILQLNINGTQREIDELYCLLHDNDAHAACLRETKLNPNLNLKIKGYTELQRDRTKSTGGGLHLSLLPTNSETEAHAIKLDLSGRTVKIVNVYHPDASEIDIDNIKDLCSSPSDLKITLGDFYAKSPSWGCPHLNKNDERIEDLLCDLNLSTLNTGEYTYLQNQWHNFCTRHHSNESLEP